MYSPKATAFASHHSFFQAITSSLPQPFPSLPADAIDPSKSHLSSIIDRIVNSLPPREHSLAFMQKTCEMQEQRVYSRLCEYRKLDIYDEMNKVSSELKDLRYLSLEQLGQKFDDAVERLKSLEIEEKNASLEQENMNFNVKIEEEEETTLHSKYPYAHILQSSEDSLSERNENEDPGLENHVKNETLFKADDMCFPGLGMNRKGKKFPLDFNNIHNFLEENENNYPGLHSEINILKEIDLNEGLSNSRLYD